MTPAARLYLKHQQALDALGKRRDNKAAERIRDSMERIWWDMSEIEQVMYSPTSIKRDCRDATPEE